MLAAAQGAKGLILLGDPQQLDQPLKGVHPSGADASALGHVLGEHATLSPERGLFLPETWRMHPEICSYISEVFYEGKLHSKDGLDKQRVNAKGIFGGTGLRFLPSVHHGNSNESIEEADLIAKMITELFAQKPTWVDRNGETHALGPDGVLVITPYNAQVAAIRARVPAGVHVGTVDKFQGQEAPIAIYSFATSSAAEAPRGMEFLYSKNRLNVAVSRAKCVSVVVASPELFRVDCKTPRQMELANAVCRFAEVVGAPKTTEPKGNKRVFV